MDNKKQVLDVFWGRVYNNLAEFLPPHALKTWFLPIVPVSLNENKLVLTLPSQFFLEWIESHYKEQLAQAVHVVSGNNSFKTQFVLDKKTKIIKDTINLKKKQSPLRNNKINKNYLFENFIEGSNNEFAKNAAVRVSELPGKSKFNPLIIYGGVGLGKTHLLHAIANRVSAKNPDLNIVIVTSEQFTLDFVNSLRKNNTIAFTKLYRSADILLIDDIQFFRGKEQTQEQFFHTFNELYQSGRQIVMTADTFPSEMKGLQDRLLSRFQSGLSVDIQPPDLEIRIAILLEKSEQNGLKLNYEIVEYIAKYIKNNIRDLEGTIIRILAKSSLMNQEIDFNFIKEVVKERVGNNFQSELSIEDIVKKVSEITQIKEKDIVGKSRKMEIAEARQLSMYLCRNIIGSSLNNIGIYFGGRDHTTVIHAVKTIDKKREKSKRLQNQVETIKEDINLAF